MTQYKKLLVYEAIQKRLSHHRSVEAKIQSQCQPERVTRSQTTSAPAQHPKILTLSLFSPMWRFMGLPIRHVVYDEAQTGQRTNGLTAEAKKNLYRSTTLLLTGTPMKNSWSTAHVMIELLQGHPFKDFDEFTRVFGKAKASSPDPTHFARLVKFMMGMTVARPASILGLKEITIITHTFQLTEEEEINVVYLMLQYMRLRRRLNDKRGKNEDSAGMFERSMCLATRAQLCAGNMSACVGLKFDKKETDKRRAVVASLRTQYHQAASGPTDRSTAALLKFIDTDSTSPVNLDALFNKNGKKGTRKRGAPIKVDTSAVTMQRKSWVAKVSKLSNKQLFSSRVKECFDLLNSLRRSHPGQKVAIFSKYLRFLDLITEALRRKRPNDSLVLLFFGELDPTERVVRKWKFAQADGNARQVIMPITAGAGGAGMNLTSASVVIQAEPWWTYSEQQQAWFRTYRTGQDKDVTVYVLEADNSMVDLHIAATRDTKAEAVGKFMAELRRPDEQMPDIPGIAPIF